MTTDEPRAARALSREPADEDVGLAGQCTRCRAVLNNRVARPRDDRPDLQTCAVLRNDDLRIDEIKVLYRRFVDGAKKAVAVFCGRNIFKVADCVALAVKRAAE